MAHIAVLGAGLVGRTIARDLADEHTVVAFDQNPEALESAFSGTEVSVAAQNLSNASVLSDLLAPFDLVVDALPGHLGLRTLRSILEAGKNTVDIAFAPEDPSPLASLAREKGLVAIVDMGVAPGMSNAILGHHVSTFSRVERFECIVGGLPRERRWPFEYRAPFSPADVLEEYTRPARYRVHGEEVSVPALSNREKLDFPGIGTLESFDTDGLRSLLKSYPEIPNMVEKTLRYPGHAALMEILRESGFFSTETVAVGDAKVRPLDVTSRLLFPHWQLTEADDEFTVMRVLIEGTNSAGDRETAQWDLLDHTDHQRSDSSMARTTGFACNAAVNLLLEGGLEPGLWFPEKIAEDRSRFDFLLGYQQRRGINYRRS
jgi:saccharopine dehydrogenase-like NADP-dependent oxidoreductase